MNIVTSVHVSVDPELVGVRAVAGPQRIRHLVTKSCEFGLSPEYKEDPENGKLREAFKKVISSHFESVWAKKIGQ